MINALTNLRPAVEEGFRGLLCSQGITAYTRQNAPENFQNDRPRVEVLCKIGAATGHRHCAPPGVLQFDTWYFDLALRAVADPQNDELNNLLIDDLVSQLRGMASTFGQSTWEDLVNFPNHLIVEALKDTTTDDSLHADDNEESSVLTFSGIVQIRTNAWNN